MYSLATQHISVSFATRGLSSLTNDFVSLDIEKLDEFIHFNIIHTHTFFRLLVYDDVSSSAAQFTENE